MIFGFYCQRLSLLSSLGGFNCSRESSFRFCFSSRLCKAKAKSKECKECNSTGLAFMTLVGQVSMDDKKQDILESLNSKKADFNEASRARGIDHVSHDDGEALPPKATAPCIFRSLAIIRDLLLGREAKDPGVPLDFDKDRRD